MQLYIIHGWYKGYMIPCAYALMKRRRVRDYKQVWDALKRAGLDLGYTMNPKQVMVDFEKAAIKSVKLSFPGCVLIGCLFHFGQSLIKNLFKIPGLKKEYCRTLDDGNSTPLTKWFKRVVALALVPLDDIED